MDPRGIEPRLPPCHGGVIPVYYGPGQYSQLYLFKNLFQDTYLKNLIVTPITAKIIPITQALIVTL